MSRKLIFKEFEFNLKIYVKKKRKECDDPRTEFLIHCQQRLKKKKSGLQ